jgi:unsaturated chondroitin disaccharide hydrolase
VVGYADTSTSVTAYSSLAMILRLNPSGVFDVRNGGDYGALVRVPYAARRTYHARMVTDLGAKRYSVWITPPGGSAILLADRFAFRSDAPLTDDLGKVSLKSGSVDNEFKVERHSVFATAVAPGEEPAPDVNPPEEEEPPASVGEEPQPKRGGCAAAPGACVAAWGLVLTLALRRRSRLGR